MVRAIALGELSSASLRQVGQMVGQLPKGNYGFTHAVLDDGLIKGLVSQTVEQGPKGSYIRVHGYDPAQSRGRNTDWVTLHGTREGNEAAITDITSRPVQGDGFQIEAYAHPGIVDGLLDVFETGVREQGADTIRYNPWEDSEQVRNLLTGHREYMEILPSDPKESSMLLKTYP